MTNSTSIVPVFIPMFGCPHQCVFCNQHLITGIKGNLVLEDVERQLNEAMSKYHPKGKWREIAFFGGSFTCLPLSWQKTILENAKPYIRSGIINGIRVSTRPDFITREICDLLLENEVSTIELGIQSTDNEVLITSKRGHTKENIISAAEIIKSYNFQLGLQMMIGLPNDTKTKALKTALDIALIKPNFVRIYPTLVLHGSPLEAMYNNGTYHPLSLESAVDLVNDIRILFEYYNINTIRTGLQANEGLDAGKSYLAGPYHPAFGELVDNAIYLNWMKYIIAKTFINSSIQHLEEIRFYISPNALSKAIGQKRRNLEVLKIMYPFLNIRILSDNNLQTHEILVTYINNCFLANKKDFIKKYILRNIKPILSNELDAYFE